MKIIIGRNINLKFAAKSVFRKNNGNRTVTNMIKMIIMLKAIIRYLNFIGSIIEERLFCVNDAEILNIEHAKNGLGD